MSYYFAHKERISSLERVAHFDLKIRVLQAYGLECECCGENRIEFLSIDHIHGGGEKHRKEIGSGGLYRWLEREGFPKGFRVLCHNCNCTFGHYDVCSHQCRVEFPDNKYQRRRLRVLKVYGSACACCGERERQFLTFDHVNGNGSKHRREVGSDITQWAICNGFPKTLRVLCYNCNMAIGAYGKCPHEGFSLRKVISVLRRKTRDFTPSRTGVSGARNGLAKLTVKKVRKIRRLYSKGTMNQYELAERFGVSQPSIGQIVRMRTWKEAA